MHMHDRYINGYICGYDAGFAAYLCIGAFAMA